MVLAGRNGIYPLTMYLYHLSLGIKRVLFKSVLLFWITFCDHRSGFSSSELQSVKDHLASPHTNFGMELLRYVMFEKLSVPQILIISEFHRTLSQITVNLCHLLGCKLWGSSGSFAFPEGVKAFLVEPLNPSLHSSRIFSKHDSRIIAAHSLTDEQNAMQPVIVP